MTATTPEGGSSGLPVQSSHHSNQRPSDTPAAVDSSVLLPMKQYLGCGLEAIFHADNTVEIKREDRLAQGYALDKLAMRQLIDFYMLGQQVLILRRQSASGTEANQG